MAFSGYFQVTYQGERGGPTATTARSGLHYPQLFSLILAKRTEPTICKSPSPLFFPGEVPTFTHLFMMQYQRHISMHTAYHHRIQQYYVVCV
jgi:hypothetical protein